MKVEDLMIRSVRTCAPGDSLATAAQLMWEGDCGCTPVVEEGSRVVGMLTDRDICMAAYTRGEPLSSLKVRDAMSTALAVCGPKDDVSEAEATMRESKVRRLPVMNGKHLVGLITLNDLSLAAASKARGVKLNDVGRTLASICEHRATSKARRVRAA